MLRAPLLALSLILLAATGAPAASVTIAPSGGGATRSLTLADLAGSFDVHGVAYTVRAADGTESTTTVADGISLSALLRAAGLGGDAFDYIELPKVDGTSAIVLRDDLSGTDQGPPVVWADDQGTHFLRPSSGEGDANGADLVTLVGGAPLAIELRAGEPLVPRIAVSTLRARPRERIDFSASLVGRSSLPPGLEYEWYFDGTGRPRGANVSHRFRRAATYLVLLNVVRGDGTWIGDPARVRIHVVRPRERRSDDARGAGDSQATPVVTPPAPPASPGAAAGGASAPLLSPARAPHGAPTPRRAPAPRRTPPGELVSGTLLEPASAAAAPAGSAPASAAVSAAARGAAADGPLRVPVGVWVAAGLVVLLTLGWALESRHTLPFWQP